MIKVRPIIDINDLKCGVIYRNDLAAYNVTCSSCYKIIKFEDFRNHFETQHLPQPVSGYFPISFDEKDEPSQGPSAVKIDEEDTLIDIGKSKLETIMVDDGTNEMDPLLEVAQEDYSLLVSKENDEINHQNIKENTSKFLIDLPSSPGPNENIKTETEIEDEESQSLDADDNSWDVNFDDTSRVKNVKKETEYPCNMCDGKYTTKYGLNAHKRRIHKIGINKKSKCNECGKTFPNERSLANHMYDHTGIICDICGKTFSQVGNLRIHKKRHTGIKPHKCQECENSFYTDKELKAHMIRHTGILRHICEVCGKRCRDAGVLTAHMRRHTGERPAKCDVCGKSFYSFHDLNVHAVAHSSERPFSCDVCGNTFQRKKALRIHKKLHSRDMKHECKVCGKKFPLTGGLTSHMRSHAAALSKNIGSKSEIALLNSDMCAGMNLQFASSDNP